MISCVALAAVTGIAIGSNIGELRMAGELVRGFGHATAADLGALEIARPLVPAGYVAHGIVGYPLVVVPAHQFFTAAEALGNPAASVAAIESGDEGAKEVADRELVAAHRVAPAPSSDARRPLLSPPDLESLSGGSSEGGGCLRLGPYGGATMTISGGGPGVLIRAGARPVSVWVRRFAAGFEPVEPVAPFADAKVRVAPDLSTVPWHVRVSSDGPATVCGL
jgi:hypothetical protein